MPGHGLGLWDLGWVQPDPLLREQGQNIPEDIKGEVETRIAVCRSAMEEQDTVHLRRAFEELSESVQKLGASMYQQPDSPPPGEGEYSPPPEDDEDVVEGEFSEA